ncbi:MAG: 1-acyl-sn-glycerol-3-phosphate acyltransferase [Nitrospirae bacterium]|nr:1-acyl-sn-glycerol-3-phosphate acyltransferase [Nitrospirota bacterium]
MLYSIAVFIISIFARLFFRIKISGVENIPVSGGVIIAANHLSYLDIPLLSYSLNRHANFVGKRQLFSIPVVGTMFRLLGGIAIDREKIDRAALREIMKKLDSGNLIVIYPEGTRSPNGILQPGRPGVGFIVRMSGKKVVPTAIQGTDKAMPSGSWLIRPHPVTIRFGKPLDFSVNLPKVEKQGADSRITQEIMDKIAALLEAG